MENDILKEALADILKKSTAGIEKGVNFLNAELPEAAEQILKWHMWESILINVFLFIMFLIFYILGYKLYKIGVKGDETYYVYSLVSIIFGFVILLFAIFQLTWLKILIAPKLYLIEYAAELLK